LSIGTWSSMSTTFDNIAAFGMVKRASFMCSELGRVVAADLVAVLLQEWEHLGATVLNMTSASRFLNRLQRSCAWPGRNFGSSSG